MQNQVLKKIPISYEGEHKFKWAIDATWIIELGWELKVLGPIKTSRKGRLGEDISW